MPIRDANVEAVDPITGLPGRREFLRSLQRSGRSGRPTFVLFLDIDRFSLLNSLLGHETGDQLLSSVASLLLEHVPRPTAVARVGADQFALSLEGYRRIEDVTHWTQRLVATLRESLRTSYGPTPPSVCVGIGELRASGAAQALEEAVIACREAKKHGIGSVLNYDDETFQRRVRQFVLETGLSNAAAQNEMRILYQPVVNLADGSLTGVEALLRWHHPDYGLLRPSAFIDIAERSGLVVPVGSWVIEQVARQAATWRDELGGRALTLWINLSPAQIAKADSVVESFRSVIERYRLPERSLGVEVTETALTVDLYESRRTIARLTDLGIAVAVDDFGTGYASFTYLRDLSASIIKVDQTFVGGMLDSPPDRAIVEAVIELGHTLGMIIVAEGVETAKQAIELMRLGADCAQGYLFSSAAEPERISALAEVPYCGVSIVDLRPAAGGSLPGIARRQSAMLLSALDNVDDAVVLAEVAPGQPIVHVNAAFERWSGLSASRAKRLGVRNLVGHEVAPGASAVRIADREMAAVNVHCGPVCDETGRMTHWMLVFSLASAASV